MERMLQVARDEKIARVVAFIRPDNFGMQKLATRVGFALDSSDPHLTTATNAIAAD
jgi:RimJ/RimL family protein N-acetyltransferase